MLFSRSCQIPKIFTFKTIEPEKLTTQNSVSWSTDTLGENISLILMKKSKKTRLVLNKMLELGYISNTEYNEALNEYIVVSLKPGQRLQEYLLFYRSCKTQAIDKKVRN